VKRGKSIFWLKGT
jgi:hypothetical protein